jgi:hypothetical protein
VLPALAAAAVAIVAISLAFAAGRDRHPTASAPSERRAAASTASAGSASASPADPKAVAIARIKQLLAIAPLPPGAQTASNSLAAHTGGYSTNGSPNEVRTRGTWTAPGTVASALAAIEAHPPPGLTPNCQGCGGKTVKWIDFEAVSGLDQLEMNYVIAPYRGRVVVRIDVWTVWRPARPSWSLLSGTVSSVDIVIQRLDRTTDKPFRPTVHRTLTGASAEAFARTIDAAATAAPQGWHSCPLSGITRQDRAVVHTVAGAFTLTVPDFCSLKGTVLAGPDHPTGITLDGSTADAALLAAVGLPSDYGRN